LLSVLNKGGEERGRKWGTNAAKGPVRKSYDVKKL